jgi:hypothetical protein
MYAQMIKNTIFGDDWESGMSIHTSIINNKIQVIINDGVYYHQLWRKLTKQQSFFIQIPKTKELLNSVDFYLLNSKIEYIINGKLYEPSIMPLYRLSVQVIKNRIFDVDIRDLRGMKMDKVNITLIRGKKIEKIMNRMKN